jgi:hypothetical protein
VKRTLAALLVTLSLVGLVRAGEAIAIYTPVSLPDGGYGPDDSLVSRQIKGSRAGWAPAVAAGSLVTSAWQASGMPIVATAYHRPGVVQAATPTLYLGNAVPTMLAQLPAGLTDKAVLVGIRYAGVDMYAGGATATEAAAAAAALFRALKADLPPLPTTTNAPATKVVVPAT